MLGLYQIIVTVQTLALWIDGSLAPWYERLLDVI
jgi:hypothetical protein